MNDAAAFPGGRGYPRDLIGYGPRRPSQVWPNGERLAVQIVVHYEEGGERSILNGDVESESLLSDLVGAEPLPAMRHANMESAYEYGSRAGFWRLMRLLSARKIPVTCFAVGRALEQNPHAASAMRQAGWEIASEGYRWIDFRHVDPAAERADLQKSVDVISGMTGSRPMGLHIGRPSANTRRIAAEELGFVYDSNGYADDLPYWTTESGEPHLVIPYSLDTSDVRFLEPPCVATGSQFFAYLRDAFDRLHREGREAPGMMTLALHGRIAGRPGRASGLVRFLDFLEKQEGAWVTRRIDIAAHWRDRHRPTS